MTTIAGKIVVVTGAAGGLGRGLALGLAKEGATVIATDVANDGLQETVRLIVASGGKAEACILDVSLKDAVYALADDVARKYGGVDIVVNNAGVNIIATADATTYEDFNWLMNINFWGAVYCTMAFLPQLQAKKSGHIVNVSSACGLVAMASQAAYVASKFAIRGYSEALRQELAGSGIAVSCVHPGSVRTNVLRAARYSGEVSEEQHRTLADNFDDTAKMTPDMAADIIVSGIKSNAPRILVGKDAKKMDRVQRLFPTSYEKILFGGSMSAKALMEETQ